MIGPFPSPALESKISYPRPYPNLPIPSYPQGRDDRLVYRSVRYEPVSAEYVARQIARKQQEQLAYLGINPAAVAQANNPAGGPAGDRKLFGDSKADYLQPIKKVSEKFSRDALRAADDDVAKRV